MKQKRNNYYEIRSVLTRLIISLYKESEPCTDCGGYFPSCAMDFDHVRGRKIIGIAHIGNWSNKKIEKEINKCDLVCAICHRIRIKLRRKGE